MKILVTGGSGLIGRALIKHLLANKWDVTSLTRNENNANKLLQKQLGKQAADKVTWLQDLSSLSNMNDYDAVVNLAGEPIVAKRWSPTQKKVIENSRWLITKQIADLINRSEQPPEVFVSGSAIGYYGRQKDQIIDESFDAVFPEFSHRLCAKWEYFANEASRNTRVCLLRTGIVLAGNGGALDKMLLPFKLGMGGPIGDGAHYMPWIHIDDMVLGIMHLLNNTDAHGPFNFTAPNPATNKEFSKTLASVLGRPAFLITPKIALKLLLGEMSDLLTHGQNVVPAKLEKTGYHFHYPNLKPALQSLNL